MPFQQKMEKMSDIEAEEIMCFFDRFVFKKVQTDHDTTTSTSTDEPCTDINDMKVNEDYTHENNSEECFLVQKTNSEECDFAQENDKDDKDTQSKNENNETLVLLENALENDGTTKRRKPRKITN